jgi:fumarate reductase subunit D
MADSQTGAAAAPGGKKKIGTITLLLFFGVAVAAFFLPTTIILTVGMLPTAVAALTARSNRGERILTVGAMNFAGCVPFLLPLWSSDHTASHALRILTDLRSPIVMYCGAGIGYLIGWAMAGIVNTVMLQRVIGRLKDIKKRKAELEVRWGAEVTGDIPLNAQGFALEARPGGDRVG